MPIYEYACTECGTEFEVMQKVNDRKKPPCEQCSSKKVVKKMSLSAFALKGDGWYKDLYGNKPGAKEGSTVSPPATSSSGSEAKSDISSSGSESKADSSKSDSGKSDGAKADSGKSASSKTESKSEKKADSSKSSSSSSSAPAA